MWNYQLGVEAARYCAHQITIRVRTIIYIPVTRAAQWHGFLWYSDDCISYNSVLPKRSSNNYYNICWYVMCNKQCKRIVTICAARGICLLRLQYTRLVSFIKSNSQLIPYTFVFVYECFKLWSKAVWFYYCQIELMFSTFCWYFCSIVWACLARLVNYTMCSYTVCYCFVCR